MKTNLFLVFLVLCVYSSEKTTQNNAALDDYLLFKNLLENILSTDVMRIIFQFFDYDHFMNIISYYDLSEQRQDVLKVDCKKRFYGTKIVVYYGGSGDYYPQGELCPLFNGEKQMAIIRIATTPIYFHLYEDGNLELKSEMPMSVMPTYANIGSFWFRELNKYHEIMFFLTKTNNQETMEETLMYDAFQVTSELAQHPPPSGFLHDPLLAFSMELAHYLEKIKFWFWIFDENKTTYMTYYCVMNFQLFSFTRNNVSQNIENVYYLDYAVDADTLFDLYSSNKCTAFKTSYPLL